MNSRVHRRLTALKRAQVGAAAMFGAHVALGWLALDANYEPSNA